MKKRTAYWLKAGSYAMLGHGAQLGFAFLNFLLLVRIWPERDLGVWTLYTALTAFAEMARMGLTQNGTISLSKKHPGETPLILSAGIALNLTAGLTLGLLLAAAAPILGILWSAPELLSLAWQYLPFALLYGTARYFDNAHILRDDFKGVFWSKFAFGAFFSGALWWQKDGLTLQEAAMWQNAAATLSLAVFLLYRPQYLRFGALQRQWIGRLFQFGKYAMGTNLFSMLYNKLDVMLLGALLNPAAVAMYNVASRVINYIELPLTGLSQMLYPKVAEAFNSQGNIAVARLYERTLAVLLAAMIPFTGMVMLFAKSILHALAGPQYVSSAPLLQILLLAVFPKIWGRLFGITLDAIGNPRLNFFVLAGSMVSNGLFSLALVPWWGNMGAAFAVLFSVIVNVTVGQRLLSNIIPIRQANIFNAWGAALSRLPMGHLWQKVKAS
ncbi:MAG: hypothetical protein KIPDCIKN_04268 [Haliscomenobacter sp.]|nr:hypothetical protein [Haliscomenobacter sp.]